MIPLNRYSWIPMKAVLIYHCGVSYNAGSVTLYPVCIRNLSYLLEMLQFQSYHIQSARSRWSHAILQSRPGGMRLHLLSERKTSSVFMHVLYSPVIQHFSAASSKNTWHFRSSKANSQTKTEPASFHWDGVIPGHLFERRPERGACGEEKACPFVLVGASLGMMTSNALHRTVRAAWTDDGESNYGEQGDPAGMVTPMILSDKAEVVPCRYMNAGKGAVAETHEGRLSMTLSLVFSMQKKKIRTQRRRLRKDREVRDPCFLYMHPFTVCGTELHL